MFKNRSEAGTLLAEKLEKFRDESVVVMAIPRGGVPVAYEIARYFNFPLDIILVKKIGHPNNSEYAIGAVSLSGYILDEQYDVSSFDIEEEILRIRQELARKQKFYIGKQEPIDVAHKIVCLVDDGIATGKTILTTIELLREKHPKAIVLAVPVLPQQKVEDLKNHVDELIYLHASADFHAVGEFYDDFEQVNDEEVIRLLNIISKK
jgi:predicted phosphoribosyltransferase